MSTFFLVLLLQFAICLSMAMKSRKNLARNIPLSIDKELLAAVDRLAGDRNETRSLIMRRAIQEGLPLVKAGGNADVLTLDSELSTVVEQATKETGLRRSKILLEAIRAGLEAFISRVMSQKVSLADLTDPKEREQILNACEESYRLYDDPTAREHRKLIWERATAAVRLIDILLRVPEAKRRAELIEKLAALDKPGRPLGGTPWPWGHGLSTEEIEWQIAMHEKYGARSAEWPKAEVDAHREAEDARRKQQREVSMQEDAIRVAEVEKIVLPLRESLEVSERD
jgi:hypothetical protein